MAAPARVFQFDVKGSAVLQKYVQERQMQRAIRDRMQRQFGGGGFAGAAVGRLTASLSNWSGAVNSDLDASLVILRSRARSIAANNEHGVRFLKLAENNIVGQGPSVQVRAMRDATSPDTAGNAAVETHWARWCANADVGGRMSLAHALRVIIGSVARDGEALVRVVRDRNLPYGIGIRLLEADRLDERINQRLANGNMIRMGVECDAHGRAIAYHMHDRHPGDNWVQGASKVERVPASEVYHLFVVERAEQVRGITWFHPVLARMAMLHGFEEAAVVAARVGAAKMGIITKSMDAANTPSESAMADSIDASTGVPQISAEPGEFLSLPQGYSLESWNPDYPHQNFDAFLRSCLRGVASGLNVATHNLTGDMGEVNYSSARIAELSERDCWMVLQGWLIDSFVRPLFGDWLDAALLAGEITFPSGSALSSGARRKFFDATTISGRRWSWVDPAKEITAARDRVALGVSSRKLIAAESGLDFEDIVADLRAESEMLSANGLAAWTDAPLGNTATMAPPAPQPAGAEDGNP